MNSSPYTSLSPCPFLNSCSSSKHGFCSSFSHGACSTSGHRACSTSCQYACFQAGPHVTTQRHVYSIAAKDLKNTLPYPVPAEHPLEIIYIPPCLRGRLTTWTHTSPGTGHPDTCKTSDILKERYWWSDMFQDINKYVTSCPTCVQAGVPCTSPSTEPRPTPTLIILIMGVLSCFSPRLQHKKYNVHCQFHLVEFHCSLI